MPNPFSLHDIRFMQRALRLAEKGRGLVEPNPMVGAIIARGPTFIAQGYHRQFGTAHAEVNALRAAGAKAKGATIYVTLEPCCHWGKTPPCTDAILAAGITRVVVAMTDPFAKVHGKGIKLLRRKGLQVDVGLLENSARALNAPFVTLQTLHRPYVIAKWAQSLDGCIALASGESKWISSETSRSRVQLLRGQVDAIIIGLGTALADDPLLIARPTSGRQIRRTATRIVFDSDCKLPPDSQLVRTIPFAPLLVVHREELRRADLSRLQLLKSRGVMAVSCPVDSAGRPDVGTLLLHLGERDYTNVLVEGGPELLASFLRADVVDEAQVFVAPIVVGGRKAKHAVGGEDLMKLADALQFQFTAASRSGVDVHLIAKSKRICV